MTRNSLDLSGKIDQPTIDLFQVVCRVTKKLGVSYVVVGATARDLVLHYGYGAVIKRATTDIDFGLQVESWDEFEALKNQLLQQKFTETNVRHRLISPTGTQIDIVPFGSLETKTSKILWPPGDESEMCVLGFQEAHDHAMQVILQEKPQIKIPVVSPPGLALLKLISWFDRDKNLRQRDAKDLSFAFENYEKIEEVLERIYQKGIAEKYDYEVTLASSYILGMDAASIAQNKTRLQIEMILKKNLTDSGPNLLVEEMCGNIENEYKNKFNLLSAFAEGFEREKS
jgi:predicted nucleotidyltransferase